MLIWAFADIHIFNLDDQMQWVENCDGIKNEDGYDSGRSQFWRVIKKVSSHYYPENWSSYVAWTNVCKVAPDGDNPSDPLYYAQLESCKKILKAEIEILSPKVVVFLTGEGWSKDFLSYLLGEGYNHVAESKEWDGHEAKAYLSNETIFISSEHPQGKKEPSHVQAIIDLIEDLK